MATAPEMSAPKMSEEEAVALLAEAHQARAASRRRFWLAVAALFGLLCISLIGFGSWVLAICALFTSLIGLSQYFDANGHLHLLRKQARYQKRLFTDFSQLERGKPGGTVPPVVNPGVASHPTR